MTKPVLSLVTGTVNRPQSFERLLASIVAHTSVEWELVVADASDAPLVCGHGRVRVLPERPRLGCVKGYNRAFSVTRGDWVIWLNDDAEVLPGYDMAAIGFMEQWPRIGLGALHYSECGGPFHVNSAWGCTYANFGIIRRSLGEHVGWFDEDLVMYGNDNSLAIRVLMADYGIGDIPEARVLHHSVKDATREGNQRTRERDSIILHQKYMPYRQQWVAAFRQHMALSETIPWSHGLPPGVLQAQ